MLSLLTHRHHFGHTAPSPPPAAYEPLPIDVVTILLNEWDNRDFGRSSDAVTDWLNARWAKTGVQVSRETICFTLRLHGRDAVMGLGDHLDGAFTR